MRVLLLLACVLLSTPAHAACKKLAPGAKINVTFGPSVTVEQLALWLHGFTCKDIVFATELGMKELQVTVIADRQMTLADAMKLFYAATGAVGIIVEEKGETLSLRQGVVREPAVPFEGVKKLDDTHYELSRAALEKLFDSGDLAKGARMVPSVKDGKSNGLKLYAIRPTSFFAAVGFQNGDLITEVNGEALTTPDRALEAYSKLKSADRYLVKVVRRGTQDVTLDIKVVKP